ncbi:MAG TPA: DUF2156 domain-containing protein [Kofleriaceae bacterium]|jgi:phosphatidylglycerol lysyltransferase|nr:DUF2156 domain-containing protein [Kofleriaceae bacterium]
MGGEPADQRERVLALLRQWGWNATGFQVLERGFAHFFDGDDACVSYVDTGTAWVVAGAPIAPAERLAAVVDRFVAAARSARRRVCFFAVEARFLDATGLPSIVIGEQATWNPQQWPDTLARRASLREQLRRARAKGVAVRALAAAEVADPAGATRRAIDALIARWQATRPMPQMSFLVDVQPFDFPEQRRYFVAEQDGRVVGFLCAVPVFARDGWLFEDFLRDPAAPNGTAELLIDAAMRAVGGEGSTYVTLGLAPLAGPVSPWLRRVRRLSSALYDFDGLHAFKSKLSPSAWDPVRLAYPPGRSANLAIVDSLRAFAGGTMVGFGLRTLLHGPALVVRLLALLLVPWTVLLALAAPTWFPSPAVQYAWVAFDLVLIAGLLALSARWHPGLAVALAIAISADAAVTATEAALYNLPRADGAATYAVIAIACAGPLLGATALWGSIHRLLRRASATTGA